MTYILLHKRPEDKDHKDLGITFDAKWSFEKQYREVARNGNMMGNFGYKLSRQTGSKKTNMKVFQVYTSPIIDYCSPIWNVNEVKHEKYSSSYQKCTQETQIQLPTGIKELNTFTLAKRNQIELIMLGFRIMRNELKTNVKYVFNNAWYEHTRTLRNPLLFNTTRIPEKSTIARIMKQMNDYRSVIDFRLSTAIQRSRLLEIFMNG